MTEKGYKGGLVSRITNKYSGKKYIISTAQEVGKDYWSIVVAQSKFLGLWMDFKNRLSWIRNNKEEAHKVHYKLKDIVENTPEGEWLDRAPNPEPPESYSKDAEETLNKKLGIPSKE